MAIQLVEELFEELPSSFQRPKVLSGGLTSEPDTILDFHWWTGVDQSKHSVTIRIKETKEFDFEVRLSGIRDIQMKDIDKSALVAVVEKPTRFGHFAMIVMGRN